MAKFNEIKTKNEVISEVLNSAGDFSENWAFAYESVSTYFCPSIVSKMIGNVSKDTFARTFQLRFSDHSNGRAVAHECNFSDFEEIFDAGKLEEFSRILDNAVSAFFKENEKIAIEEYAEEYNEELADVDAVDAFCWFFDNVKNKEKYDDLLNCETTCFLKNL